MAMMFIKRILSEFRQGLAFTFLAIDLDLAAIYIRERYLLRSQKIIQNVLQVSKRSECKRRSETKVDGNLKEIIKDNDKNLDDIYNKEIDSISQIDSI